MAEVGEEGHTLALCMAISLHAFPSLFMNTVYSCVCLIYHISLSILPIFGVTASVSVCGLD